MKSLFTILILSFLTLNSCSNESASSSLKKIYTKELSFEQIFTSKQVPKFYTASFKTDDKDISFNKINASSIDQSSSKTYTFEVAFFSEKDGTEKDFGKMYFETEFKKAKLSDTYFWLPFKTSVNCFSKTDQLQLLIDPTFQYFFTSPNQITAQITLVPFIGDSNAVYDVKHAANQQSVNISGKHFTESIFIELTSAMGVLEVASEAVLGEHEHHEGHDHDHHHHDAEKINISDRNPMKNAQLLAELFGTKEVIRTRLSSQLK